MNALASLYQELILEHDRHPHNHGRLEQPTHAAEGHNPLCGDRIRLWLRVEGGRILEATFEGRGCAISRAAGSMMTDALLGLSAEEAGLLAQHFTEMLRAAEPAEPGPELAGLAVFAGVRQFPTRIGCALLSWDVLRRALGA